MYNMLVLLLTAVVGHGSWIVIAVTAVVGPIVVLVLVTHQFPNQEAIVNKEISLTLVTVLLVVTPLACSLGTSTETPDTQATIDAAIAATSTAAANMQATVDAAVEATAAAGSDTQATDVAAPTPTPAAEYVTMTEEEMAVLIDQSVTEAVAAMETASAATADAAADSTLTAEEAEVVELYVMAAEEAIVIAEELINAYYGLYADLAYETLYLLEDIEDDLATMAEYAVLITTILEANSETIEQGLALAEETITQLQDTAQLAYTVSSEAHAQSQEWRTNLSSELDSRAANVLAVPPNQVATDRLGALVSGFQYVDGTRGALDDNRITQSELANIAQLGANASASLEAHGGPQLQQRSGSIDDITQKIARGQWSQARTGLGDLEKSLGSRPEMPDRPPIEAPDRPEIEKPDRPGIEKPDRPGRN